MERYAASFFCEDVRKEASRQISMIGVYNEVILVPELPHRLNQLCVLVQIATPVDRSFSQVQLTGQKDGKSIFEIDVPPELLERELERAPSDFGEVGLLKLIAVVSPCKFASEGHISISITADGEQIPCPGIYVKVKQKK